MKAILAHSTDIDTSDAVEEIILAAREELGEKRPRLALLFAGIDHDFEVVLQQLGTTWPGMELIGCSTDGEISTAAGFQEDSLAVVFLSGEDFSFVTGVADGVSADPEARVSEAVQAALARLASEPGPCITTPTSLTVSATAVVNGFRAVLGDQAAVFGATAADQWRFEKTAQFYGREVLHDAVPFVLFGNDVAFSFGCQTGWIPIGKEGRVTEVDGMLVKAIDGQPATEFYRHYLGNIDLTHLAEYPLAVFLEDGEQHYLRASMKTHEDSGWLQFAGEVPAGARVRITHTTRDGVIAATSAALDQALDRFAESAPTATGPALALCFSCAGRKQVLGTRTGEEWEAARVRLGNVPALGYYGYGEICPGEIGGPTLFHNESFGALLLGERGA